MGTTRSTAGSACYRTGCRKENVIPDEAVIKLNVRTLDEDVRTRVLDAITRIVEAEAAASRAPERPEITPLDHYQLVRNDVDASTRVRGAFDEHFGGERVFDIPPISASEDLGSFGSEWGVPSVFWTSSVRSSASSSASPGCTST